MFLHNLFEPLINFSSKVNRKIVSSESYPILKFYSVKFRAHYHPCDVVKGSTT
jgi:hypothetical protein